MARAGRRDEPVDDEPVLDGEDLDDVEEADDADVLEETLAEALGDDEDDEELPEGFTVVGPDDVEEADDGDDALGATVVPTADDDERAAAVIEAAARAGAPADDEDDGDDLAMQRAGEFVCSRCHLVKRDTQLARPRLLICRDCA